MAWFEGSRDEIRKQLRTNAGNKLPEHLIWAMRELYQEEIPGDEDNPRIRAYFESTSIGPSHDEVPWCAAFVGWCLERAGAAHTRGANARSYMNWGRRTTKPRIGDIIVFWRGSPEGWMGHVAFFVGRTADGQVLALGGNQGNRVCVQAYDTERILGYRTMSTPTKSTSLAAVGILGSTLAAGWLIDPADVAKVIDLSGQTTGVISMALKALGVAATGYITYERIRKMFTVGV